MKADLIVIIYFINFHIMLLELCPGYSFGLLMPYHFRTHRELTIIGRYYSQGYIMPS